MHRKHTVCLLSLLWLPILLKARPVPDPERSAILRVVQYYFEGENLRDLDKLAQAYHPQAQLTWVDTRTQACQQMHVGTFLSTLREQGEKRPGRSLRLRFYDRTGQVALVRTQISGPEDYRRLHDHLVLMQIEDEWRIVSRTSYWEWARFSPAAASAEAELRRAGEAREALNGYLRQRRHYQASGFETLFHPAAHIAAIHPRYAAVQALDRAAYIAQYAEPPQRQLRLQPAIESLEVEGDWALAKVSLFCPRLGGTVTDYVLLYRQAGTWRILDKATYKDAQALHLPV